jgi:predicted DNA-binding ribbon-helix-helix protein
MKKNNEARINQMNDFEKQIEPTSSWVKSTLKRLDTESPQFSSNKEAIAFYEKTLVEIAERRAIAVAELIALASSSAVNEEDLDLALSLSSKIFGLKGLTK